MWLYPDGSRVLELSTRCAHRPRRSRWRPRCAPSSPAHGVDVSGEQQTKTRKALEFFAKRRGGSSRTSDAAAPTRRSSRAGSGAPSATLRRRRRRFAALAPERVQESDELYLLSRAERRLGQGPRRADGRQAARAGERRRARAVAAGDEGRVPARRRRRRRRARRRSACRSAARAQRRTRSTSSSTRSSSRAPTCWRSAVHKRREHYTLGGCMAELTELSGPTAGDAHDRRRVGGPGSS